ncbi:hypothetical protein BAG01nite_38840 [Brevibacillus agri]|uniref:Uncharacterized protein n=1 Tax=Brevibacillus agri TaxID=51101 RepID=A0A3M8BEG2_9BACL|nr:hypothetical protein BA6348_23250 [Brevibacillus agri]RNB61275.1 hypothetical protein EB820_01185 [Brevibacillus agri]GED27782.1 hypothetical protein BAG01nite_38840 [Brevibacillus agri]
MLALICFAAASLLTDFSQNDKLCEKSVQKNDPHAKDRDMMTTSLLHFTMYRLKINKHACVRSDIFANFALAGGRLDTPGKTGTKGAKKKEPVSGSFTR